MPPGGENDGMEVVSNESREEREGAIEAAVSEAVSSSRPLVVSSLDSALASRCGGGHVVRGR
mgnify:FL=1